MRITLIAALAANGVIGRDNALPWRIPEDLRRFKQNTLGHPVIMGRKTWESLGRPLPGRNNIVITRQDNYVAEGAQCAPNLDQALALAESSAGGEECFVIGGSEIYGLALARADRMLLTEVARNFDGDASFPAFDKTQWREVSREALTSSDGLGFAFVDYRRRHAVDVTA